jgi:hypothetical protein
MGKINAIGSWFEKITGGWIFGSQTNKLTFKGNLEMQGGAGGYEHAFQNKNGTLAHLEDITAITSSFVNLTDDQTVGGIKTFTLPITGSLFGTASFAVSSSRAISSSFATNALSASFATTALTASFVTGSNVFGPHGSNSVISSSFAVSSSRALSSSFATTSSFTTSASFAATASSVSVVDAGSDTTTFVVLAGEQTGNQTLETDAGIIYNASTNIMTVGGITGSLFGTASYATQALSSSFATTALTASFVTGSNVFGPFGSNSILSASFATSSSRAVSSSFATSASFSTSSSFALSAATASFVQTAQTASYVLNAVSSSFATTALTASFVTGSNVFGPFGSNSILSASFAVSSSRAVSSSFATNALSSSFATTAATASFITGSNVFGPFGSNSILSASFAVSSSRAVSSSFATTALSSSFASKASSVTLTTDSQNFNYKVPFSDTKVFTTGDYALLQDSEIAFTYNPSTNILSVGTFSGSLSGNATTATTAATASFITGSNVFGPFGSNSVISASFAATASFALNAVPTSSLLRQEFTYTSGGQTFTTTETINVIYAVFVNGQELTSDQYSSATNVLTITNTLVSGDKISILYAGALIGVSPFYTKSETDALLDTKIGVTQVTSISILASNWVLVSGFYEYELSNGNITSTSIVEAIPDNSAIDIVTAAELLPRTDSSAGSVKFYAKNLPTGNFTITINIYK